MTSLMFPLDNAKVSWDTKFTQSWDIAEQKTASGRRRTLCQQTLPAWVINVTYPMLTKAEKDALLGFYAQCKGKFMSFWYKDAEEHFVRWLDLEKGSDGTYQCLINYGGFTEPALKVDDLKVFVDGICTYNFTEQNGKITINTTGAVSASYDYYWRVCFGVSISISQKFQDFYTANIKLEVVRE